MTLFKLSLRNAKRQARDYLVYLITVTLSVALIYAFNGLIDSPEIKRLSEMMDYLMFVIIMASIAVVFVVGWLVHYTTRFLLLKRSRELGTYILLGMEQNQVSRLFFMENITLGGAALAMGILLGNLFFQFLRAILLAMFDISYRFNFSFSAIALGLTLLYFALIYLFALLKGRRLLRRMKISALLNYDRRNETEIIKNDKSRRKIFALSLVCGVAGTALLITGNLPTGTLGSVLIVMFLYGFFISFSSGVPAFFDKRPRIKYAKTHLLVYRSLASKLNTTGVTMATISLLITATLLCEGAGFIFNTIFERRDARATNHDLYIYSEETETGFEAYKEYISAHIPVRESREYTLYNGETGAISKWLEETVPNYLSDNDRDLLLKMSDYAALRKMLGFPEARLEPGAYIIHCMDYLKNKMENYHAPLTLGGQTLAKGAVYTEEFSQWDGNGENFILAVPDEMAENLTPAAKIYALMTVEPVRGEKFTALRAIQDAQYEARLSETPAPPYYSVQSKAAIRENTAFMNAVFVFPLFYLSIVLTMTAATILTIQLLSEAGRYRKQYALLRSQGMDARDMNRSLRRQFALFYAMPALPPVLICLTFMLAQIGTLDAGVILNRAHAWGIIGLTLAVFFVIYLIYIAASYISFKRSVLPE